MNKINKVIFKNKKQKEYYLSIKAHDLVFGIGHPGTGKTFIPIYYALDSLFNKDIDKIILCRPIFTEESMGYLPGDISEKMDPLIRPIVDAMHIICGIPTTTQLFKENIVEIVPLAYINGRTFTNCFVILDEAQYTSNRIMRNFLTRFGDNTKAVITGDINNATDSGLTWAINKLISSDMIGVHEFEREDVIRSELVKEIIKYLEK